MKMHPFWLLACLATIAHFLGGFHPPQTPWTWGFGARVPFWRRSHSGKGAMNVSQCAQCIQCLQCIRGGSIPYVTPASPSFEEKHLALRSVQTLSPTIVNVRSWHTPHWGLDPSGSKNNKTPTPPHTLHARSQDSIVIPHLGAGHLNSFLTVG